MRTGMGGQARNRGFANAFAKPSSVPCRLREPPNWGAAKSAHSLASVRLSPMSTVTGRIGSCVVGHPTGISGADVAAELASPAGRCGACPAA